MLQQFAYTLSHKGTEYDDKGVEEPVGKVKASMTSCPKFKARVVIIQSCSSAREIGRRYMVQDTPSILHEKHLCYAPTPMLLR